MRMRSPMEQANIVSNEGVVMISSELDFHEHFWINITLFAGFEIRSIE